MHPEFFTDGGPEVELSVVVPAYNEEDNVVPLWEEVRDVLTPSGLTFEVIIVDDGSRDRTFERLQSLTADPRLCCIRLGRNYGQSSAMAAGIRQARGRVIALLDGDRQNDPREILRMLPRLDGPATVVCGWRRDRKDHWLRSWVSRQANALISRRTSVYLHDYGCTLKLFPAALLKNLPLDGEMHRFIPVYAHWEGARSIEMEVNHRPRVAGQTKYGLDRTFRVVLDLATVIFLTKYRGQSMRFFGRWAWRLAGLAMFFILAGMLAWWRGAAVPPITLMGAGGLCFLGGMTLVSFGLLGELGWRIYFDALDQRPYRVAEIVRGATEAGSPAELAERHAALR